MMLSFQACALIFSVPFSLQRGVNNELGEGALTVVNLLLLLAYFVAIVVFFSGQPFIFVNLDPELAERKI